ncbi:MAG: hypothetical protein WKF68_14095 [Daejeonella sp.]
MRRRKTTSKRMALLTDIQGLSTNGNIVGMIYKFSQTIPGYNWTIENGTLGVSENAGTGLYNKRTGMVTTTFDPSKFTNSTDLGIARVILHEGVHAYLQAYFGSAISSGKTYNDLIIMYLDDFGNTGTTQHNLMVTAFREDIGHALEEYGASKGYTMLPGYYQDLAWGGLMKTTTYTDLSQTDKDRIYSRLTTEQYGVDKDGNPSTQLGAATNCP